MKIEKIPEGYLLAKKGSNGCELWRTFNGAESIACEAIDELIAERDALRTALEKIADWDSAWGPYPETNEAWRAMVIVTAREAVPRRGEKK